MGMEGPLRLPHRGERIRGSGKAEAFLPCLGHGPQLFREEGGDPFVVCGFRGEQNLTGAEAAELIEQMAKDLELTVEEGDYDKLAKDNGYDDIESLYNAVGIDPEYATKFILRDKVNKELFSMAN